MVTGARSAAYLGIVILLLSARIDAYIDPGTALSTLSGIIASAGALLVLLGGLVLYPVRRVIQYFKLRK